MAQLVATLVSMLALSLQLSQGQYGGQPSSSSSYSGVAAPSPATGYSASQAPPSSAYAAGSPSPQPPSSSYSGSQPPSSSSYGGSPPSPGYAASQAPPSASYGASGQPPSAGYGASAQPPAASYGASPAPPSGGYGGSPPSAGYGASAQPPSAGGYGASQSSPSGGYGSSSPTSGGGYDGGPQAPTSGGYGGGASFGGGSGYGGGQTGGDGYGGGSFGGVGGPPSILPQPPGGSGGYGGSQQGTGSGKSQSISKCPTGTIVAFTRVSRARLSGNSIAIGTGDDIYCAQYCANNIEPFSGQGMSCAAFNWDGQQTCYFFDYAATPAGLGILAPNAAANNFYYEKTCLKDVTPAEACTYRSYTFERLRNTYLTGFAKKSVQVNDREACLSACLKEKDFVCRSVNYNYNTYFCELSDQDRRSKPQYLYNAYGEPIDYFDNNCLTRQNRCGYSGGNLVFVKTVNFEIHYYDFTSSIESSESYCLQKCLDSYTTFCRSLEFSTDSYQCVLSDEDTFSRADQQGEPQGYKTYKDYYEPVCVASDLTSSTFRQQAAFTRLIGQQIVGDPVASAQQVTVADCISLCFQNLECASINYDQTESSCYIYATNTQKGGYLQPNTATDYYEFNGDSQFGGIALCTSEGIKFVVNSKEPYTGAIYAAENFQTCNQVVTNAKQIQLTFPPPTVSQACGTTLENGMLTATVVVSLDGVLPHQVTTEYDRFYKVTCDTTLPRGSNGNGTGSEIEGTVVVTTLFDAEYKAPEFISVTPVPPAAKLQFVDQYGNPVSSVFLGDPMYLQVTSDQATPRNMMLMDCIASPTNLKPGQLAFPFKVIDNGCPTYPALVGPVAQDFAKNRLLSVVKAFRLDGTYWVEITCSVMFCAGQQGCPASNCLDSAYNNVFQSYGRRKRSARHHNETSVSKSHVHRVTTISPNVSVANVTKAPQANYKFAPDETFTSHQQLSAVIRVLADGDEAEDAAKIYEEALVARNITKPGGFIRDPEIVAIDEPLEQEELCVEESTLIAAIASYCVLCTVFAAVLTSWCISKFSHRWTKP